MLNEKLEIVDDMSNSNATAQVITWTTNEPTVSYTYTVADGTAPTSTELGIIVATQNAQIAALITLVAEINTAIES